MAKENNIQYGATFIPIDRRFSLAENKPLPDRSRGAVLFADVSGFTLLTEAFVEALGPKRGAEEFPIILNQVYDALIARVHQNRGSVIGFSGDAITCWFDLDDGHRAVSAALGMQAAMGNFGSVPTPDGRTITLAVKIGVNVGVVRRFMVGDPQHHRIDVLAGNTVDLVALAEQQAKKDEILVTSSVKESCGPGLTVLEWRWDRQTGERFGVVGSLSPQAVPQPWPVENKLPDALIREWQLPALRERLNRGQRLFLAELRPVVAMFIRFRGIDYDQDDGAGDKLDRFIRWVQQALARYEGVLLQITMGDKGSYLYAAFGAPVAHNDDANRAISAAESLITLPPEMEYIRNIQIGVALGQMRTGESGSPARQAYAILGDKANLAARLMSLAPPGAIYCDQDVYLAAQNRWQFDVLPATRVKGKASLIRLFQPIRRIGSTGQLRVSTQKMVGRQRELAYLEESLEAVRQGGQWFMQIKGEAGIGKSQLLEAFGDLLNQQNLIGLAGFGQSIEQQTPYRAWRDILLSYFGVEDIRDPGKRRLQIQEIVAETLPDQLPRLPVLEDILQLGFQDNELTRNLPTDLRQQNVFLLVLALMRAWANEQPLILVLEDAHWLDSISWELSLHVARGLHASGEPLLLVWVNRPIDVQSPLHTFQKTLENLPSWKTLALETLGYEDIVDLIRSKLNLNQTELPPDLVEFISSRAEGNPFFAQELLFALREQNLIQVEQTSSGSRCIVQSGFTGGFEALPNTLQGLILTRIDRLSPRQQFVLKVASVIGRTFPINPLHYVLNLHVNLRQDILRSHLDRFSQLDLIQLENPGPELTYLFKHIITQEVAYQTLLYSQRRQLHRAVAEWYEITFGELETLGGDGEQTTLRSTAQPDAPVVPASLAVYLPLLVFHYRYAEEQDRELHYVRLAAEKAKAIYANEEALIYLNRAIELTPAGPARYPYYLAREEIFGHLGRREEQLHDLETLSEFASIQGETPQKIEILLRKAAFAKLTGDYPQALASAEGGIAIGREKGDQIGIARGEWMKGQILVQMGEYERAREYFEHVLAPFETAQAKEEIATILGDFGLTFFYQGDFSQAIDYFNRALAISREIGDRRAEGRFLGNMGSAYGSIGEREKEIACHEQVLAISREIGDRRVESIALGNLGIVSLYARELTSAEAYLENALTISREIGDRRKESTWLGNLGGVYLFLGLGEKSIPYFEQALTISRGIGNRNGEGIWLDNLGVAYRLSGDLPQAVELLEKALAISREIGYRNGEGNRLDNLATVYADMQDWEKSVELYQQALEIRRDLGQVDRAINSLAGLANVACRQNQLRRAARYVEEIWEYFLRNPTLEKTEDPFRVFLICYRVFKSLDDDRAWGTLRSATSLLKEQAERIADPEMKESFLRNVSEHKTLLEELAASPVQ